MRLFIALFIAILPLFGANLIKYELFDRGERVDILLTFDAPYAPQLSQNKAPQLTTIYLNGITSQPLTSTPNSPIISAINISSDSAKTIIALTTPAAVSVEPAMDKSQLTMRLRITPSSAAATATTAPATPSAATTPSASSAPAANNEGLKLPPNIQTKDSNSSDESLIDGRYLTVLAFLIIILIAASWLKKRMLKRKKSGLKAASNRPNPPKTTTTPPTPPATKTASASAKPAAKIDEKDDEFAFEIIEDDIPPTGPVGAQIGAAAAAAAFGELAQNTAAHQSTTKSAQSAPKQPPRQPSIISPPASTLPFNMDDGALKVIFERPLDSVNKVSLISLQTKKYLILTGTTNVLLDSFGEDRIEKEEDFAAFFEDNKSRLNKFIESRQSALGSYKDTLQESE